MNKQINPFISESENAIQVLKNFNLLKNSPVLNGEYYMHTRNLCNAIMTITEDILMYTEFIRNNAKRVNCDNGHYSHKIDELDFQIGTIAGILEERSSHADYQHLEDLIYYYKELEKESR